MVFSIKSFSKRSLLVMASLLMFPFAGMCTFSMLAVAMWQTNFSHDCKCLFTTQTNAASHSNSSIAAHRGMQTGAEDEYEADACCTVSKAFNLADISVCVGDSPRTAAFTLSVGGGGSVTALQGVPVPWKVYNNVAGGTFTVKCECTSLNCKCSGMCAAFRYQVKYQSPNVTLSSTTTIVGLALEGNSCGGVPDLPELRGCTGYVTNARIVPWPVEKVENCLQSSRAEYPSGSNNTVTLSCLLKKRYFPALRVGTYSNCTAYENLTLGVGCFTIGHEQCLT